MIDIVEVRESPEGNIEVIRTDPSGGGLRVHVMPPEVFDYRAVEFDLDPVEEEDDILEMVLYEVALPEAEGLKIAEMLYDPEIPAEEVKAAKVKAVRDAKKADPVATQKESAATGFESLRAKKRKHQDPARRSEIADILEAGLQGDTPRLERAIGEMNRNNEKRRQKNGK